MQPDWGPENEYHNTCHLGPTIDIYILPSLQICEPTSLYPAISPYNFWCISSQVTDISPFPLHVMNTFVFRVFFWCEIHIQQHSQVYNIQSLSFDKCTHVCPLHPFQDTVHAHRPQGSLKPLASRSSPPGGGHCFTFFCQRLALKDLVCYLWYNIHGGKFVLFDVQFS